MIFDQCWHLPQSTEWIGWGQRHDTLGGKKKRIWCRMRCNGQSIGSSIRRWHGKKEWTLCNRVDRRPQDFIAMRRNSVTCGASSQLPPPMHLDLIFLCPLFKLYIKSISTCRLVKSYSEKQEKLYFSPSKWIYEIMFIRRTRIHPPWIYIRRAHILCAFRRTELVIYCVSA